MNAREERVARRTFGVPAADDSGIFWRGADSATLQRIRRLNQQVGSGLQPWISQPFVIFTFSLVQYVLFGLFLRVRIEGWENVQKAGNRAIYACRHFFEWDPALIFCSICLPRGIRDVRWAPHLMAGHFWTRTRWRRFVSYMLSNLAITRGDGFSQPAFLRAAELLSRPGPRVIGIFPTGPMGRSFAPPSVRPGVGYLALTCPNRPIVPVTMIGVQTLRWADVLRLRRPVVRICFGEPFRALELEGEGEGHREVVRAVQERIARTWAELEAR